MFENYYSVIVFLMKFVENIYVFIFNFSTSFWKYYFKHPDFGRFAIYKNVHIHIVKLCYNVIKLVSYQCFFLCSIGEVFYWMRNNTSLLSSCVYPVFIHLLSFFLFTEKYLSIALHLHSSILTFLRFILFGQEYVWGMYII